MPRTLWTILLTTILGTLAFAGCHEPDNEGVFAYTARDFEFEGPDALPSGWVTLELTNEGPDLHHIQLFRLTGGKTADDYRATIGQEGGHPDWVVAVGGPNAVGPGETTQATVFLEEGAHVMVCEIPDARGVPHEEHGMVIAVDVGDEATDADEPEADTTVVLSDFAFNGTLDTDDSMVRVENVGGQPHELFLLRYEGDAGWDDFMAALGPNATGPPPIEALGGLSGIAAGDTAYFPVDLEPGSYGFACFLTDPGSGAPHFALGMQMDFEVE